MLFTFPGNESRRLMKQLRMCGSFLPSTWVLLVLSGSPLLSSAAPGVLVDPPALEEARTRFARERRPVLEHGLYEDVRSGVVLGQSVAGSRRVTTDDLLAAAKLAGFRVLLSPAGGPRAAGAWTGLRDGILFVAEAEAGEKVMWYPAFGEDGKPADHRGSGFLSSNLGQAAGGAVVRPGPGMFHGLRTHLLLPEFTEAAVRVALKRGHLYVADDELCDPTGFVFGAVNNLGVFPMGDTAPMAGKTRLSALTPLAAKLKLFCNGKVVSEVTGTNLMAEAKDLGSYRLEAWLEVGGVELPWIYSNPVEVRAPGLADLQLPSTDVATNVVVHKDLVYVEGPEDPAEKHKLDLYVPKGKSRSPVFFFVHGGAWKYGDRSQYPPLGNRYAQEGFVTVVPSYRLAPKHPFPAQIEDVAAAFAWTVRHVAEYGGDTNRICIGGHSAGGHLAALLALDGRRLGPHGVSPNLIRGVLALSGAYNLTRLGIESDVFGNDPATRRDASPLFFLRAGAPPFLVTYCEWDYYSLPAQAKELHAGLRQAGLASELVFVPGKNHISEMLSVTAPADPTVTAALRWMNSHWGRADDGP